MTGKKLDAPQTGLRTHHHCTACGYKIQPAEIMRPRFDLVLCPKCGATFIPVVRRTNPI